MGKSSKSKPKPGATMGAAESKSKRKSKKEEEEEEPPSGDEDLMSEEEAGSEEEEGSEEEGEEEEESESEEEDEEDDDDEEEGEDEAPEGETEEEKAKRLKAKEEEREKKRKTKCRRKGHRKVATKAGFSADFASDHPDRDVGTPILSLPETIRAAKWAPRMANKAAFEGLDEFKERSQLANESLPPGAVKVLRDQGEIFLRKTFVGTMTRMADASRGSPSVAMVHAETRPLRRALKYSFVGTDLKGLMRYAQNDQLGERLGTMDGEATAMQEESDLLVKQSDFRKDLLKKAAEKKKKKAEGNKGASSATSGGIAKKKSKKVD